MPFTATHVFSVLILVECFRIFFPKIGKKFPRYYILIVAVAGVFPDLEYIFMLPNLHRGVLHSLIFPLIFLFWDLSF